MSVNVRGMHGRISAKSFIQVLAMNVENDKMSDEAFREMIKNTLPAVEGGEALVPQNFVEGERKTI